MPAGIVDMSGSVEEKHDHSAALLDNWLGYIHQVIEEEFFKLTEPEQLDLYREC